MDASVTKQAEGIGEEIGEAEQTAPSSEALSGEASGRDARDPSEKESAPRTNAPSPGEERATRMTNGRGPGEERATRMTNAPGPGEEQTAPMINVAGAMPEIYPDQNTDDLQIILGEFE